MRLFSFLLRLFLLAVAAVWLAQTPGEVVIVWWGTEIKTSAAILLVALILLFWAALSFFKLLSLMRDGPRLWRWQQKWRKNQKGLDDLTRGLVAIAAGDGVEAGRCAVLARKALGDVGAAKILQAQAAQLAQDKDLSRTLLKNLALDPATALLGYRGLIQDALAAQNFQESDRLLAQALQLAPQAPWLVRLRFESAARQQDWAKAHEVLLLARRLKSMTKAEVNHFQSVVFLEMAEKARQSGKSRDALKYAEQAYRDAPDSLPTALGLAQAQIANRAEKAALRLLERTWRRHPHKDIADLYKCALRLLNPEEKGLEIYKKIERFTKDSQDHPLARLVLAEAALGASLWGEARRHLLAALKTQHPTQTVYRLLAQVERLESHNEAAAARWLAQGFDSPSENMWHCRHCAAHLPLWSPSCPSCHTFATIDPS